MGQSGVNPFTKFYQDSTRQMPLANQQRMIPAYGPPQIETVPRAQLEDSVRGMLERGFIQIGFASFDGPTASREQLMEQARNVGAQAVILTGEYSRTTEGVVPSLSFQPGQTYTTREQGTITGNTGYPYGTYSGSSTTTTPGTFQTQYTPYQMQIYSQGAIFWRKLKPGVLGAYFVPIPNNLRSQLQRNTGALITAVVDEGPAFKANLLRGDVIIELANEPVATPQELFDLIRANAGQTVPITLIRGAETKVLHVHLNPDPHPIQH
jgi:hypothetical protein